MAIQTGYRCGNCPTTVPASWSTTKNPRKRRLSNAAAGGCGRKNSSRYSGGIVRTSGSSMTTEPPCAIRIPALKYTAGSRPPLTYSEGGTKKNRPAASTTSASGAAAVRPGPRASDPSRSRERQASATPRQTAPLSQSTRSRA